MVEHRAENPVVAGSTPAAPNCPTGSQSAPWSWRHVARPSDVTLLREALSNAIPWITLRRAFTYAGPLSLGRAPPPPSSVCATTKEARIPSPRAQKSLVALCKVRPFSHRTPPSRRRQPDHKRYDAWFLGAHHFFRRHWSFFC